MNIYIYIDNDDTKEFQDRYPLVRNFESGYELISWELVYAFQIVGVEFFYRGFMVHGLKHRYGHGAVWVMLFPYFMIHFRKPGLEACGAVFAGILLGLQSLRTGSIAGGVAAHVFIAWTMDNSCLITGGQKPYYK